MSFDKGINLIQLKPKVQRWRIGLIWGLIVAIVIINFSCSKSETNNEEYYVKYEVNSSTIYYGTLSVVLKSENNQSIAITTNTSAHWEGVIGPVKKGFEANVSVSENGNNYGKLKLFTQISVSKNGSPFALKKIDDSSSPRTSVQISYTIDY